MKNKIAQITAKVVRKVAEDSADKASPWKYFQPKVPAKLKEKRE